MPTATRRADQPRRAGNSGLRTQLYASSCRPFSVECCANLPRAAEAAGEATELAADLAPNELVQTGKAAHGDSQGGPTTESWQLKLAHTIVRKQLPSLLRRVLRKSAPCSGGRRGGDGARGRPRAQRAGPNRESCPRRLAGGTSQGELATQPCAHHCTEAAAAQSPEGAAQICPAQRRPPRRRRSSRQTARPTSWSKKGKLPTATRRGDQPGNTGNSALRTQLYASSCRSFPVACSATVLRAAEAGNVAAMLKKDAAPKALVQTGKAGHGDSLGETNQRELAAQPYAPDRSQAPSARSP